MSIGGFYGAGGEKVVVKKESTAALIRKQQARQQASLATVYDRQLALDRAVAKKGQENAEHACIMDKLADEVAALTKIQEPIKGRAGTVTQSYANVQLHAWCLRYIWSVLHIVPVCKLFANDPKTCTEFAQFS